MCARWFVVALALALAAAGCGRAPTITARPALWRVADADTTIWLIGTIHALPTNVAWQTPAVLRAIDSADTLILEVPPTADDNAHARFLAVARAPALPPLLARVAPGDRALLTRAIAATHQTAADLDGYKTWGAALVIGAGAGHAADASAANGVEPVLTARFAHKAIGALETHDGQFRLFDRLPEASQRRLLLDAARDALDPERGYRRTLAAWANGDAPALAASLDSLRRDPVAADALIVQRNRRWAGAIARRMARPGRALVAVGAGHLVGAESVVALLRARGFTVERVE